MIKHCKCARLPLLFIDRIFPPVNLYNGACVYLAQEGGGTRHQMGANIVYDVTRFLWCRRRLVYNDTVIICARELPFIRWAVGLFQCLRARIYVIIIIIVTLCHRAGFWGPSPAKV